MEITAREAHEASAALQKLATTKGLSLDFVFDIALKMREVGITASMIERTRMYAFMKFGEKDSASGSYSIKSVENYAAFESEMAPVLARVVTIHGDPLKLSALKELVKSGDLVAADLVSLVPLIADDTKSS